MLTAATAHAEPATELRGPPSSYLDKAPVGRLSVPSDVQTLPAPRASAASASQVAPPVGAASAIISLPPAAGRIADVRERRAAGRFSQQIVLAGGIVGDNGIDIDIGPGQAPPSEAAIASELGARFPGVAMDPVPSRIMRNPYGPFHIAIGAAGGSGRCLFAWQAIDDLRRGTGRRGGGGLLGGRAGASVRVKLCRRDATLDQLAAYIEQIVIGAPASLDRVWEPERVALASPLGQSASNGVGGLIGRLQGWASTPDDTPTGSIGTAASSGSAPILGDGAGGTSSYQRRAAAPSRPATAAPADGGSPVEAERRRGLLERIGGLGSGPIFGSASAPPSTRVREASAAPFADRRDAGRGPGPATEPADEQAAAEPCRTRQAGLLDRWFAPCRPVYSRPARRYQTRQPGLFERAIAPRRDYRPAYRGAARPVVRQSRRPAQRRVVRRSSPQDPQMSTTAPPPVQDQYQGGPRYLAPVQGQPGPSASGVGGTLPMPAVPVPSAMGGRPATGLPPAGPSTPTGPGLPAAPGTVGPSGSGGLDPSLPSRAYRGPGN